MNLATNRSVESIFEDSQQIRHGGVDFGVRQSTCSILHKHQNCKAFLCRIRSPGRGRRRTARYARHWRARRHQRVENASAPESPSSTTTAMSRRTTGSRETAVAAGSDRSVNGADVELEHDRRRSGKRRMRAPAADAARRSSRPPCRRPEHARGPTRMQRRMRSPLRCVSAAAQTSASTSPLTSKKSTPRFGTPHCSGSAVPKARPPMRSGCS